MIDEPDTSAMNELVARVDRLERSNRRQRAVIAVLLSGAACSLLMGAEKGSTDQKSTADSKFGKVFAKQVIVGETGKPGVSLFATEKGAGLSILDGAGVMRCKLMFSSGDGTGLTVTADDGANSSITAIDSAGDKKGTCRIQLAAAEKGKTAVVIMADRNTETAAGMFNSANQKKSAVVGVSPGGVIVGER